jgi:hypothetical protein
MLKNRHRHRLTAWIAIFAILVASLMPAAASAFTAQQNGSFASDICSVSQPASDASRVAATPDSSVKTALHFEHCPFCVTHAGVFGLPATPALAIASPVLLVSHATLSSVPPPLTALPWATPQSRAPPVPSSAS